MLYCSIVNTSVEVHRHIAVALDVIISRGKVPWAAGLVPIQAGIYNFAQVKPGFVKA